MTNVLRKFTCIIKIKIQPIYFGTVMYNQLLQSLGFSNQQWNIKIACSELRPYSNEWDGISVKIKYKTNTCP